MPHTTPTPDSFPPRSASAPPQRLLVDTNIVLDWLVFHDDHSARWLEAVRAEHWLWCASPAIVAEYRHMADPARWPDRTVSSVDSLAHLLHSQPEPVPALDRPRCTDRDDQMFVDLALALAPATVLTRDRALLAMRKRLARRAVTVVGPHTLAR